MSIQRFKECRTCGKTEPRRWTEADLYQCDECQADTRRAIRDMITQSEGHLERSRRAQEYIANSCATQNEEQAEANRRRLEPLIDSLTSDRPAYLPQSEIAKQRQAAQRRDPRSVAMARAMAQDPRPAARGTQQDPMSDPMHLLNPLNPFSPVSPLNPLNDWDDSSHRHASATSASSCDDSGSSYHHTSHDSGSSYDSGSSDSSSYTSGGCD